MVLYNGSASALVSVTAPTLSLEPPGGEGYPRRQGGEQDAAAPAARALNRKVPRTVLIVPRTHEANAFPPRCRRPRRSVAPRKLPGRYAASSLKRLLPSQAFSLAAGTSAPASWFPDTAHR